MIWNGIWLRIIKTHLRREQKRKEEGRAEGDGGEGSMEGRSPPRCQGLESNSY